MRQTCTTAWSLFDADSSHFEPGRASFMVNYRVDDLDGMLEQLRGHGCTIVGGPEESEYGKFGWVLDPEDNKVELWEPPAGQ